MHVDVREGYLERDRERERERERARARGRCSEEVLERVGEKGVEIVGEREGANE